MRIIINADDFGFTKSINSAIINCVKFGTISSTTVMVNMPYCEDIKELLQFNHVGIGLHFNLTQGKCICDPMEVSTLVNAEGYFHNVKELKSRISKGLISKEHIQKELNAQINKLRNLIGDRITHIDSHQDINKFGLIVDTIIEQARSLNIKAIRWYKKAYLINKTGSFSLIMPTILNFKHLGIKRILVEFYFKLVSVKINSKLSTPQGMLYASNHNTVTLLKIFHDGKIRVNERDDCFEIMVHPAENITELFDTSMLESRIDEYRIMMTDDFKSNIKKFDLVNFQSIYK